MCAPIQPTRHTQARCRDCVCCMRAGRPCHLRQHLLQRAQQRCLPRLSHQHRWASEPHAQHTPAWQKESAGSGSRSLSRTLAVEASRAPMLYNTQCCITCGPKGPAQQVLQAALLTTQPTCVAAGSYSFDIREWLFQGPPCLPMYFQRRAHACAGVHRSIRFLPQRVCHRY